MTIKDELIEKLAELCHEQWCGWMKYLFNKCDENNYSINIGAGNIYRKTGELIISKELVGRWKRQLNTDYKNLSEKEKESDRIEARKFIELLEKEGIINNV